MRSTGKTWELSASTPEGQKCVHLWVEMEGNKLHVDMTPTEARRLARRLLRDADRVELANAKKS